MTEEDVAPFGWADPDSPFDMGDYKDDRERRFVEAMRARALEWAALGVRPEEAFVLPDEDLPFLRLGVDVVDRDAAAIVRSYQVRFDSQSVVVGEDPTGQFTDPPDPRRSATLRADDPEALAAFACGWLEAELKRPVERHEWETDAFLHTRWVMADTSRTRVACCLAREESIPSLQGMRGRPCFRVNERLARRPRTPDPCVVRPHQVHAPD
jgi:hypothetical protein